MNSSEEEFRRAESLNNMLDKMQELKPRSKALNPLNAAWEASVTYSPRRIINSQVQSPKATPVRTRPEGSGRNRFDASKFEVVLDLEQSLLNARPLKAARFPNITPEVMNTSQHTEPTQSSPLIKQPIIHKLKPGSVNNLENNRYSEKPNLELPTISKSPEREQMSSALKRSNWRPFKIDKVVTINEEIVAKLQAPVSPKVSSSSP